MARRGTPKPQPHDLSRRERQIMDVLYAAGEATAADVQAGLPDSPSYSTVRALLRKLLDKGQVRYRQDGPRYVYVPVVGKSQASESALRRLVDTFFDGSAAAAVVNLLGRDGERITENDIAAIEAELDRLKRGETT
ncbi:MAG: BlaI/MecI/CopY family transcriptional regulator [Pseudomonadales bacterium]